MVDNYRSCNWHLRLELHQANTGTYYGFYVANSGPCSDPSYSKVIVTDTKTGCLDAVNDTYGTYNGFIGGITPSVLANDSL